MDDMDQQHGGLLSPPELSPLEQEVLEEYERLATNMRTVRAKQESILFAFPFFSFLSFESTAIGWNANGRACV